MKREFYSQHSEVLGENMSMIVYGEGGYPVIAFQAQDAKSNNFEDFGMIDVLAPFIDEGRIQVFSVDNLDEESWSDQGGDNAARAARQEDYFRFVTDELIPRVHAWNNSDLRPIAVGCSMGATHAAIAALRRPDLFQGCIALSGVYRTSFFFGDWMDENLYNNDVCAFLSNMPEDHPYVDLYNQRQLVMCVGQGAWEEGVDDLRFIDGQLDRLGVKHWCDFWGYDVNHDWPWWRKQMPYFMAEVLSDIDAQQEWEQPTMTAEAPKAEVSAPVAEAKPAAPAVEAKPAAKKPVAKKAPVKRTATKTAAAKKAAAETAAVEAPVAAAAADAAAETKAATAKKTPAKRTATKTAAAKKATTAKTAATKAAAKEVATEVKPAEAPAAKTTAAKTATKTAAAAANETTTAVKPAAKRTTTRKATSAKVTTAATTDAKAATDEAPAKKAPAKRATRRTTKKADTTDAAE